MIGRYGRTVRPQSRELSAGEIPINEGRTDRTSVPVKWEIRRETVSSEHQNFRTSELQNIRTSEHLFLHSADHHEVYILLICVYIKKRPPI